MKTLRFIEYYLPSNKITDETIKSYTRDELYGSIYSFMNMPPYVGLLHDPRKHKFSTKDLKKVYHDLELSDESYDVIRHTIQKNDDINIEIKNDIKRYGNATRIRTFNKFDESLLPKNQRKIIEDSFDFSYGTIKRGNKYLSFIMSVSILIDGEWRSLENENKYLFIK